MWRDWFFTLFNGFVLEDIYVVVSHVFLQGETWGKSSVSSTCLLPSNPTFIGWSMAYLVAALPLNRRIRSSWLPNYKNSNILNGCWALVRSNWLLAHLVEFESLFCNNQRTGPKKKKNRNSRALESELGRNCLINLKGHVLLGESYQVLHLFPINYVKLTVAIWLLNIFENTSPLARILLLICTSQMEQIILYNAAKYCSHCLPPLSPLAYLIVVFLQVTYMGNIKTSWGCLNMVATLLQQTISSLGIMLIEGGKVWKPYVCFWPTKSDIPTKFTSWEVTMRMRRSTGYMGFMTSVNGDLMLGYGKYLPTASIVCLLPHWLMRRYFACTEASLQSWNIWVR